MNTIRGVIQFTTIP